MRSAIVIGTVVLAIAFAPAALAGNGPTSSVYDHTGKQVQATVNVAAATTTKPVAAPAPTQAVASTGTLPFTGLDLGFLAGAGVLLVAVGVSLRRITRKTDGTA